MKIRVLKGILHFKIKISLCATMAEITSMQDQQTSVVIIEKVMIDQGIAALMITLILDVTYQNLNLHFYLFTQYHFV